ncbi:MAG TPA: NUDIX hydrolase [Rhodocyclaceae bacterium]|nr:NUDIX hydrolase [Rhodocyclaceae bacterium]
MTVSDPALGETGVSSELLVDGLLLKAWRDEVRLPDGSISIREFIKHPGACIVIAELRPGVLVFERQFRYPVGQVLMELPAGKLDAGEEPLACARRELLEETGYVADSWQHIATLHPCVAYSNEHIEVFLARGLKYEGQQLDEGEFLEVFEMSLNDAEAAVFDGRITDAKTIACLFWARRFLA